MRRQHCSRRSRRREHDGEGGPGQPLWHASPRDEAIEAIAACGSAGIRVKMITGDHAATARTIAGHLALVNPNVLF